MLSGCRLTRRRGEYHFLGAARIGRGFPFESGGGAAEEEKGKLETRGQKGEGKLETRM